MTLGVMQVMTSVYIDDARSVELGNKKIRQSFERFVQEKMDENDRDYDFGVGEPEKCIREICMDYNGAEDYVDAIKYIYYILCPRDTDLDEVEEITECCQRRIISGTSELLKGISVSEIDSLVVEGSSYKRG